MSDDRASSVDILIDVFREHSNNIRDFTVRLEAVEGAVNRNAALDERVEELLKKVLEEKIKTRVAEEEKLALIKSIQSDRSALLQFITGVLDNKMMQFILQFAAVIFLIWVATKLGVWEPVSVFFGGKSGS